MITPEQLLNAYRNGYFPMADSRDSAELHWYYPEKRGIIPLDSFHIPDSLPLLTYSDATVREKAIHLQGILGHHQAIPSLLALFPNIFCFFKSPFRHGTKSNKASNKR